jgi:hypothetical protein
MMVDSMPTGQAPPSSTSSSSSPSKPWNSSSTCWAVVGLTRPKRLALGAARPCTPQALAGLQQGLRHRVAGQRRPIESCPPAAATPTPERRGKISVSGPGQHAAMRPWAKSGTLAGVMLDGGLPFGGCAARHVHDQRVVAGAAFGREYACHGAGRRHGPPGRTRFRWACPPVGPLQAMGGLGHGLAGTGQRFGVGRFGASSARVSRVSATGQCPESRLPSMPWPVPARRWRR